MARPTKKKAEKTAGVWQDPKTGRWRWEVKRRRPDNTLFSKNGSFKERADAEARHAEVVKLFESGESVSSKSVYTLKTWAEYVFENVWSQPNVISYNTRRNYTGDLRKHVFEHKNATVWLDKLETKHVREILADAGGSQHLRANLRNAIARLLRDAQKEQILPEGRRVTDAVSAKRSEKSHDANGVVIETFRVLTVAEQEKLLKKAEGHWAYLGILMQLKMGLRRGEAVAVRRADIQNGIMHVKEQLIRKKGEGVVHADTKTRAGIRSIPLPEVVKRKLSVGGKTYLLEIDGGKVDPDTYSKAVSELIAAAGLNGTAENPILPSATSHDLRHTFGSMAACKWRFPIKTLSVIMGHSNIATTMKYYVHADADDTASAMALVA